MTHDRLWRQHQTLKGSHTVTRMLMTTIVWPPVKPPRENGRVADCDPIHSYTTSGADRRFHENCVVEAPQPQHFDKDRAASEVGRVCLSERQADGYDIRVPRSTSSDLTFIARVTDRTMKSTQSCRQPCGELRAFSVSYRPLYPMTSTTTRARRCRRNMTKVVGAWSKFRAVRQRMGISIACWTRQSRWCGASQQLGTQPQHVCAIACRTRCRSRDASVTTGHTRQFV